MCLKEKANGGKWWGEKGLRRKLDEGLDKFIPADLILKRAQASWGHGHWSAEDHAVCPHIGRRGLCGHVLASPGARLASPQDAGGGSTALRANDSVKALPSIPQRQTWSFYLTTPLSSIWQVYSGKELQKEISSFQFLFEPRMFNVRSVHKY